MRKVVELREFGNHQIAKLAAGPNASLEFRASSLELEGEQLDDDDDDDDDDDEADGAFHLKKIAGGLERPLGRGGELNLIMWPSIFMINSIDHWRLQMQAHDRTRWTKLE